MRFARPMMLAFVVGLPAVAQADDRTECKAGIEMIRAEIDPRVGEVRIFYDVTQTTVDVLAIVTKSEARSWLALFGNPE